MSGDPNQENNSASAHGGNVNQPYTVPTSEPDLSDGSLPESEKQASRKEIDFFIRENYTFLWLKGVIFVVALCLAAAFLSFGLNASLQSLDHIKDLQSKKIELPVGERESAATDMPNEEKKDKKPPNEAKTTAYKLDPMLSAGSIITLVAFMLGVGLTLLLTLMKFTFSSQRSDEQQDKAGITVAGPLSELISNAIKTLSDKFKRG
ncbi:hypothetical protein EHW61_15790 [Salinivibrio sp. VYel6]|uniref:hypothetical protein n=1 Tax=Salinivibrio sp. VYel6 TaxID=2490493 RepID=UPI00128C95C2|nr:hypothetical protein [Salinivibrio sp. VYel6]MPX98097.1 hypothetical protein [Salinivibrio sp. VYel6]